MPSPAAPADPDLGLFGPDSLTWRVHGDPSMALGGVRALLLQALHPLAMAGVAQHSTFREDPWGRLLRTAEFVGATTFGTTSEARRAAARVRRVHHRLTGVEPESGLPYRVDDPELLLWVHVTEVDSFLTTARRCGLRLSGAQADAYFAEQVRAAELVGVPAAAVPASRAEVGAYYRRLRPQLRLTREGRRALWFVLNPPMPRRVALGTPARPAWYALTAVSLAMLPRWARRLYRLPGLPTTDLTASATGLAVRTALLALPPAVRHGPHQRAARARLAGRRPPAPPVVPATATGRADRDRRTL